MPPRVGLEKGSSLLAMIQEGRESLSGGLFVGKGSPGGGVHRPNRLRLIHSLILLLLVPILFYCSILPRNLFLASSSHYEISLGDPFGNQSFASTPAQQIPPYVHYVYGLSPDGEGLKPFGFIQYLTISSALVILRPEVIYFHHVYPPSGWWWEQLRSRVEKSGTTRLELVKQRNVEFVDVIGQPVEEYAHKADVIRLEVLRDYGGIYLDTDVVVIKGQSLMYLKLFYHLPMVMGVESHPDADDPALVLFGLSNAVILSKPFSSFIVRWLDSYKYFDKNQWPEHSTARPWLLAQQNPLEITVLNKHAFPFPQSQDSDLDQIHLTTTYKWKPNQFTYQYSSSSEKYLSSYDPDSIHVIGKSASEGGKENSFTRLVRGLVGDKLRKNWRGAVRLGLVDGGV